MIAFAAVTTILVIVLFLGLHLLYVNFKHTVNRPIIINYLQVVTCGLFFLSQQSVFVLYALPASAIGNNCTSAIVAGDIIFITFMALSVSILAMRATCLMEGRWKIACRGTMGVLILVGLIVQILAKTSLSVNIVHGNCVSTRGNSMKYVAKYMWTAIYLLLLLAFVIPISSHFKEWRLSQEKSQIPTVTNNNGDKINLFGAIIRPKNKVQEVVLSLSVKMTLVLLAYLITTTLLMNDIGEIYKYIFYSMQNYFAVLANTVYTSSEKLNSRVHNTTTQPFVITRPNETV